LFPSFFADAFVTATAVWELILRWRVTI